MFEIDLFSQCLKNGRLVEGLEGVSAIVIFLGDSCLIMICIISGNDRLRELVVREW